MAPVWTMLPDKLDKMYKPAFSSALHVSEHFMSVEYIIRENATLFSSNILEF